ncbi:uncharacterized protein LOC131930613 [Physella acuta]|uniref:uncharacterized protein LOC131930613 n=1 Tax=Physella acuta TaxID=109671 RepID=UPI0027DB227A|nr:uncharacterized protein LOC131930613 [Physella acuta]
MFEIPDDDNFWDDLPLDGLTDEPKNVFNNTVSPEIPTCSEDQSDSANNARSFSLQRCKRKFPGPAGILPPTTPSSLMNVKSLPEIEALQDIQEANVKQVTPLPSSQSSSDDVFNGELWKTLLSDLGTNAALVLEKFSVKSMLLKASRKVLHRGKIPLLVGIIENLELQGSDASFIIRDTTGKMNGSLHRDLVRDPGTALQSGSVLVLRQVSVISPSPRTHYLNVTPGNIVLIYTSSDGRGVFKRPWSPLAASPDTKLYTKDTVEIPSLKEIIEESELELSLSLQNFRQNLSKRPSLLSPMSDNSFTSFSPGKPRFSSHPAGSRHSLHMAQPGARHFSGDKRQLFSSVPQQSPHLRPTAGPNTSYMISGAKAVRSGTNNNSWTSAPQSSAVTPELRSLDREKRTFPSFNVELCDDSFPDDDNEMLELCDAVNDHETSQSCDTENLISGTKNITANRHFEDSRITGCIETNPSSSDNSGTSNLSTGEGKIFRFKRSRTNSHPACGSPAKKTLFEPNLSSSKDFSVTLKPTESDKKPLFEPNLSSSKHFSVTLKPTESDTNKPDRLTGALEELLHGKGLVSDNRCQAEADSKKSFDRSSFQLGTRSLVPVAQGVEQVLFPQWEDGKDFIIW